jgi:hypothetical protein
MRIDEDIFRDCRIMVRTYRADDVKSKCVQGKPNVYNKKTYYNFFPFSIKGYIQFQSEMPFRSHLYSELQIKRYIGYCKKEKYSFVHIDATALEKKGVKRNLWGIVALYQTF